MLGIRGAGAAGQAEMIGRQAHLSVMKNIELPDAEAEALARELGSIIESARYPLSPRIQTLRGVFAGLRPEPARPAPPGAP